MGVGLVGVGLVRGVGGLGSSVWVVWLDLYLFWGYGHSFMEYYVFM